MKTLLSTIMLLSLTGSLYAMEGQWKGEEKEQATQEPDKSYDIPFEEIEQFLNQGYRQEDEDGAFFENPGIAGQLVGDFAFSKALQEKGIFLPVCDAMKKALLCAVTLERLDIQADILLGNIPLDIRIGMLSDGEFNFTIEFNTRAKMHISGGTDDPTLITLAKTFKFLQKCRWQFSVLLNKMADESQLKYTLDAEEERIFSLLPKPIQAVLEEHVIHPISNPTEIDSEQESNKEEQQ